MAACSPIVTMSSADTMPSGAPAVSEGKKVITCTGLIRNPPGRNGPSLSNGIPRSKFFPVLTIRAACTRLAGVTKLSVPISSSSPHRPQLLSSLPSS